MSYEIACDRCGNRTEDCECEPGFPWGEVCPILIYNPANHPDDLNDCGFCREIAGDEVGLLYIPPHNGDKPTRSPSDFASPLRPI